MAFGTGFLQGLQVGQQYQHNQTLMNQRQEDRDREQYGRDLEALMNDWNNTKGDRDDDEFVQSDEFLALTKRHRGSKVFEKAMQTGNTGGKYTKMRDIVQNPNDPDKTVLIVDTYDKDGKLISKGRPVTEGRGSREDDPGGRVAQFSRNDIYAGIVGAMQQSGDFKDRRGIADRFEAALIKPDQATKGLGAGGAPAISDPTKPTPPVIPKEGAVEESGAKATPVPEEEQVPAEEIPTAEQVEEEVGALQQRYGVLRAELDELQDVDARHSGQMTRQQYVQHRRELGQKTDELTQVQGVLDELTGSSTARRMGASLSEVPGNIAEGVGEFGEAIANIPAVKGVTDAVSEFFGGLTSGEGTPPPQGTKSSERFEHGSETQANASKKDKKGPLDPANLKDRTRAQQNKIEQVAKDTALAVANQQKLNRKMMGDYRKALRAQVLHGDITVAQATTSYYAVLAANKSKDKFKLHLDSSNGVAFTINEADGTVSRSKYADGANGDKTAAAASKVEEKHYKRLESVAKYIETQFGEGEDANFMALADQTSDALNILSTQPGFHATMRDAYGRWKADAASEANWNPFLSVRGAQNKRPSLTPYLAARVLAVPEGEQEAMNDFAAELAYLNGGNTLSEAEWAGILGMAQERKNSGLLGQEALTSIIEEIRASAGQ